MMGNPILKIRAAGAEGKRPKIHLGSNFYVLNAGNALFLDLSISLFACIFDCDL
jgi:hypothetical protein